jgi:hypothetical protein
VKQSWSAPVVGNNKARTLHIKLSRLAKSLEKWHRLKMAENKRESLQSQQTVLQLDKLQDERPLTESEFMQRKEPKYRILGLEWVTQTPNSWKKNSVRHTHPLRMHPLPPRWRRRRSS